MAYNFSTVSVEQFQKNRNEMLSNMRTLEEFCDVNLISEDGGRIRAHRVVLASASTLLRDMFQSDEEKEEYQIIFMQGVSTGFMSAMVEIIYNGETRVKEEDCEKFLIILKKYKVLEDQFNQDKHLKTKYDIT